MFLFQFLMFLEKHFNVFGKAYFLFDAILVTYEMPRLAGVRFGSGSGVLGPNLNLHPGFGSGKW